MVKIGASLKYELNLSASSVADVTMTFRAGRILSVFLRRAKRTSVWMVLS